MNKRLFLLILIIFSYTGVFSQLKPERRTLQCGEYERNYLVYLPQNIGINKPAPVLFVLHGGGGTARGLLRNTRARFNWLARQNGFVVVYPNGIGKSWNDGARDTIAKARKLNVDDVTFFDKMIADLKSYIVIDTSAIFACGISNGGFMVQRLAFEIPAKIKAVAVVAANLSVVQSEKPFPSHPVSILFINGTHDPLVPFNGGYVTVFKQNRGEVLSVDQSVKNWCKINGATQAEEKKNFPNKSKTDGCVSVEKNWINPDEDRIQVKQIVVKNGGHTWPGSRQYLPEKLVGKTTADFNACNEIWKFFDSLR